MRKARFITLRLLIRITAIIKTNDIVRFYYTLNDIVKFNDMKVVRYYYIVKFYDVIRRDIPGNSLELPFECHHEKSSTTTNSINSSFEIY